MTTPDNYEMLVYRFEGDNTKRSRNLPQRRKVYADWLNTTGGQWFLPNLDEYAKHLQDERKLSAYSINGYIGSIRSAYRLILEDEPALRGTLATILDSEKGVNQAIEAMRRAADSDTAKQKVTRPKGTHKRLSIAEVEQIFNLINSDTLKGRRDLALICTLFCTGLRDVEISMLRVEDLRKHADSKWWIFVPASNSDEERFVELGEMEWVLKPIWDWLNLAEIRQGFIFRRFQKGEKVSPSKLSPRGVYSIVEAYPLIEGEKLVPMTMLNIRVTYARTLFKSGVPIQQIHENLGHKSMMTTIDYIGELDAIEPKLRVYKHKDSK